MRGRATWILVDILRRAEASSLCLLTAQSLSGPLSEMATETKGGAYC